MSKCEKIIEGDILNEVERAIDAIQKSCPDNPDAWNILGFITPGKEILSFGSDSKIVGRLFEVIAKPFLEKAATTLNCKLGESTKQTVYPDFWFEMESGQKIAVDIKSTYRSFTKSGEVRPFNFTLGAYSSFLRNKGTKNIEGKYSDYVGHLVFGFLYTRNDHATVGTTSIDNIDYIIPSYKDVQFFVQEKFKIAGQKKGSGNTNNIATIKSSDLTSFIEGQSYFTDLGNDVFEDYWRHYPVYTDSKDVVSSLYTDLNGYFSWLRRTGRENEATNLEGIYSTWKSHHTDSSIS